MNAAIRDGQALGQGFRLGELRVDPRSCEVTGTGGHEQLDPRVMDVPAMLAQHAGQVVLREDLLAQLWPNPLVPDARSWAALSGACSLLDHLAPLHSDPRWTALIAEAE